MVWCAATVAAAGALLALGSVLSLDLSQCVAPLGMESGEIPDSAVSASSSYHEANVAPHLARLNRESLGGAWCPRAQVAPGAREWLQVELGAVHVLTALGTQGRFGNGQGREYAEGYALEYWRPRLARWVRYRSGEVLAGNTNTYLEVKSVLSPPVWASRVRFVPHATHRRTVCMRVEVYGCRWAGGVLSYSLPAGDARAAGLRLADDTYDGAWSPQGDELRGGLGQLVDGEYGGDEIVEAARRSPWVGWSNHSRTHPPALTFEFERVREFTALHIHTNNKFTRDVQVFSEAVVWFSVGGVHYQAEAVRHRPPPDRVLESARNVTIALHRRIGRHLRLELHFAAAWVLVSEVVFESAPALGNHSAESGAPAAGAGPPLPPDPWHAAAAAAVAAALAALLAAGVLLLLRRRTRTKCPSSPARGPRPEDDYQEPYEPLKPPPCLPYTTVQLHSAHDASTLLLQDRGKYEYAEPEEAPAGGVPELPSHRLRMISKLAEGAFGTVYVAEADGVPEYGGGGGEGEGEGEGGGRRLVAVKCLCAEASPEEVAVFERDVRVLATLAHPALARVLAVCRGGGARALVLEYPAGGDLCAWLRAAPPALAVPCLALALQLAEGMRYLEELRFVHRDLAARNLLLGPGYRLKIADLGSDSDTYAADYCSVAGRVVAARWAAPEAALHGLLSSRSDVFSFGVTLHELFSRCRRRPYAALSDHQVVCALRAGTHVPGERSAQCPRAVYRLMVACWRRDALDRPSFREAHAHLERLQHTHTHTDHSSSLTS